MCDSFCNCNFHSLSYIQALSNIVTEKALSPQRLKSLLHEARNEALLEWLLASQRVKKCRVQLEIFEVDHAEARGLCEQVEKSYRLEQCKKRLQVYELECERILNSLLRLKSWLTAFEASHLPASLPDSDATNIRNRRGQGEMEG